MLKLLFHSGVSDEHWSLISNLHLNACTVVRWMGRVSEPFLVEQGIRQRGIISKNFYKVYMGTKF